MKGTHFQLSTNFINDDKDASLLTKKKFEQPNHSMLPEPC